MPGETRINARALPLPELCIAPRASACLISLRQAVILPISGISLAMAARRRAGMRVRAPCLTKVSRDHESEMAGSFVRKALKNAEGEAKAERRAEQSAGTERAQKFTK